MILKQNYKLEAVMDAAVVTTAPDYVASFVDHTTTSVTPDATAGTLNGTTAVDVIATPGASTFRQVMHVSITNMDTVVHWVTLRVDVSATDRYVKRFELLPFDSIQYDGHEWFVLDFNGSRRYDDRLAGSASLLSFAHVSGGGGIEANYVAGQVGATALTTLSMTANKFYAAPFVAPPRAAALDRVALYVTTGVASSTARIGIYDATSETNLYPNALLWESSALSCATSSTIASENPGLTLVPGRLYWAAVNASSTQTLRAVAVGCACPIFGFPNAISGTASQNCLDGSRTYGALPNPFTASIAAGTGSFPAVFLRFSA